MTDQDIENTPYEYGIDFVEQKPIVEEPQVEEKPDETYKVLRLSSPRNDKFVVKYEDKIFMAPISLYKHNRYIELTKDELASLELPKWRR